MKKASKRNYNLTDSELCLFTSNLISKMTRDSTQFAAKGVDGAAITALEALGNAYEVFPPDSFYKADVSIAVDTKNDDRTATEMLVRSIVGCAKVKWGVKSPQVKKFGANELTKVNDASFLTIARQTVLTATTYLSDLTSVGLTQAMIDDLEDTAQDFENDLNAISSAQELRDLKTQERIDKGNEVYSYVVNYCEIGKIIWEDVDESKYNDYVIYPAVHTGLAKPQNVTAEYDPLDPPNITLTFDDVEGATSFDVFYDIANTGSPSGDYSLLNNYAASPIEIPSIIGKRNYFKIKAKNATNTSNYSDEVFVDVPVS